MDRVRDLGLAMIDDRNRTAHMYREALAVEVFSRLAAYAAVMDRWLGAMEETAAREG
jgi:hypothetical protein